VGSSKKLDTSGPKPSQIEVDLWYSGINGVVGVKDGGKYFESVEIKQKWESRQYIPSSIKRVNGENFQGGYNMGTYMFANARKIIVDTSQGALFMDCDDMMYD
jgi:hypothetical protein